MKKRNLIIILLFLFSAIQPDLFRARADDTALFRKILAENTRIKTIDAEIIQNINTPESGREIFRGRYRANEKGEFRIDYSAPSRQIVVNDGQRLLWYYPDEGLVYQVGESGMQSKPRVSPLFEFKSGDIDTEFSVLYLGEHLFGFFSFAHQFIIKDKQRGIETDVWIDSRRMTVLSKIIRDKEGREIIKENYDHYREINKIFVPTRVDIYARTLNGITRNITEYRDIKLNYKIPENIFKIKFPANVEKRYLSR